MCRRLCQLPKTADTALIAAEACPAALHRASNTHAGAMQRGKIRRAACTRAAPCPRRTLELTSWAWRATRGASRRVDNPRSSTIASSAERRPGGPVQQEPHLSRQLLWLRPGTPLATVTQLLVPCSSMSRCSSLSSCGGGRHGLTGLQHSNKYAVHGASRAPAANAASADRHQPGLPATRAAGMAGRPCVPGRRARGRRLEPVYESSLSHSPAPAPTHLFGPQALDLLLGAGLAVVPVGALTHGPVT
jgi:hypothetical protein